MRDGSGGSAFEAALRRRQVLGGGLAGAAVLLAPGIGRAQDLSPLGIRAAGDPKAPERAEEWFSLTCTHCARFSQEVFPEIKTKLIDTGKLYYVFHDFPLDRVALMAAAVARSLPPAQYLPFVDALLASQDRWAFAPGVDPKAQLKQLAELAGMSPASFDAAANNIGLMKQIIAEQDAAQKKYGIDATPTFIFGGKAVAGEMTYAGFVAHLGHSAA